VVARLGEEVTVKRLRRRANWTHRVDLLAENPVFPPLQVDLRVQSLAIEGLAVGVLRLGLDGPIRI
jgi:repressor LexA